MPANPWELRADLRPLEAAAQRWTEIGELMARRGDDLVDAARRATEGWDADAAESYENHRRQVLAHLDRFTTLAAQIAGSLRAVSAVLDAAQKELDQNWTKVAAVPHEVVGESRHLVFKPTEDEDRGKVTVAQTESEEIRRRLRLALDRESDGLRAARAELVTVRTELMTLTGSAFPGFTGPGLDESGVGTVPAISTSVPGAAQAGVSGLAPIGPISVSMPDLQGVSGTGPVAASAAAAALAARRGARPSGTATPPMGGMGAGGMAARAGTMSRGMASGRAGSRMAAPRLERTPAEEAAARTARDKERLKEAKRAALEEKRAERAARRAEREAERHPGRDRDKGRRKDPRDDERDEVEQDTDLDVGLESEAGPDADTGAAPADGASEQAPPAIRVVHEPTPRGPAGEPRR